MTQNKKSTKTWIVFAVLILLGVLIYSLTDFLTELLWFREMGYIEVFFTEIKSKFMLGVPTFIVVAAFVALFFVALKRSFLAGGYELDETGKKAMRKVGVILSLVFSALLTTAVISALWWQILRYINASQFGVSDPLFNNDIGFYVFKLEFLQALNASGLHLIIALVASTFIYYIALINYAKPAGTPEADSYEYEIPSSEGYGPPGPFFDMFGKEMRERRNAQQRQFKQTGQALFKVAGAQISIIGVLAFLMIGIHFALRRYDLLYSGTGVTYGAGYTDIVVRLNMYRALIVLSALSAIFFVLAIKRRKIKLGIIFPILMAMVLGVGTLATGAVQSLVVSPDEINKERPYLKNNIEYTRMAYDIHEIRTEDFVPRNDLSKKDVLANMGTLSNVRINDFEPAKQFYNQTQSIRTYYRFNDADVDRYYVNGEYTQVFLSAREIDKDRIEDQWLIRHLKYTHGYGITLSRVDKVTSSGQPDILIDSIPPVSEVPEIQITRPEIYYGESTDDYVIVNSDEEEFDYPSGESNVYCRYEGDGGIELNFFNRLLFAIRERSLKLLVSTNINSDSRILINRNIAERVEKIAPFLMYDDDPYIVVSDGKLYWMVNAYTYSFYYPYSEPYSEMHDINYVRNSVKVVVDAYNGDVNYYICDENDPLIRTLAGIYPTLFKSMDEMPEGLRSHVQYPNALFAIQADVYRKYHMTDVEVFYQNEDLWQIAKETYGQEEIQATPNYFIMKLPGEQDVEFVSSIPYTPNGKNNMSGILMARSDGENYGKIVLYRMPKDRIIYGPAQIEAQINQDVNISKEFALWNNSGSKYSRGNLYVLPVEGSLLYAEPIYMESATSSLPEVKRVIVYYNERLAYEATLAECLDKLFGAGAGDPLLTLYPIESGKEAAAALEKAEKYPPAEEADDKKDTQQETPSAQEPGETVDPESPKEDPDYKALANEAYEKALEYLQKMKEYLDMLGPGGGETEESAPGGE